VEKWAIPDGSNKILEEHFQYVSHTEPMSAIVENRSDRREQPPQAAPDLQPPHISGGINGLEDTMGRWREMRNPRMLSGRYFRRSSATPST
jgi:hypothetical protein